MALDDVRHVEAIAIIRALAEDFPMLTVHAAALAWCEENHPPPEAYMAAMRERASATAFTVVEHCKGDD